MYWSTLPIRVLLYAKVGEVMPRNALKAKRRRQWKRRKRQVPPVSSHDEMHLRLGEFLTASARVETEMFHLGNLLHEGGEEALFESYSWRTFGKKIEWLKEVCDPFDFGELKGVAGDLFRRLEELLPLRNSIVHGETYGIGQPPVVYRIGVSKTNVDYLQDFVRARKGEAVYTAEQVRNVSRLCLAARAKILALYEALVENAVPMDGVG